MKCWILASAAVLILCASSGASRAKTPVRSYDSCTQLADQRGFQPSERRGMRRKFIRSCMMGTQQ